MNNEELLKGISEMLKKHEDYLYENPELLRGIHDRFYEAVSLGEELSKAEDEKPAKPKTSKSGYRDWQPKDKYEDAHQADINKYMDMGFSHREAERFAGAHDSPADFATALNHKINPSHPSDKYLDIMRELALDYKKKRDNQEGENADPAMNPQKFASHKHAKAHEEAYGDYTNAYNDFLKELDEQDLHPLEYDEAVSNWQKDWHEQNPDARDKMIESASAGSHYDEAKDARSKRIEETAMNIISGGASGGVGSSGEFSIGESGGQDLEGFQGAAQMVGGTKGEGGYEASTVKDPAAIFSQQNPEFVAQLRQKFADKLSSDPEAKQRHDAMPHRERTPSMKQPAPVKKLTPEQIQAEYGDKYKISKPKGENN